MGDTAFYAKRRSADHGNETWTNSSECCEPTAEERSAVNPHATFCGSGRRATASRDPVLGVKFPGPTRHMQTSAPFPIKGAQIRSAAFSAIMLVGTFVLPLTSAGTEASTTRSCSTP